MPVARVELEGETPGAHESERSCVDLLLTAAREGSPTQRVAATQGLALSALRGPGTGFVLLGRVGVLTPLGRDLREVLALYEAWYDGFTWLGVVLVLAAGLTAVTRRWRVGGLLLVVGVALVGQRLWAHSNARRPLDLDEVRELLFSDAAGRLTKRAGSSCEGTPLSLRRRSDVYAAVAPLQPRLGECTEAIERLTQRDELGARLRRRPSGREVWRAHRVGRRRSHEISALVDLDGAVTDAQPQPPARQADEARVNATPRRGLDLLPLARAEAGAHVDEPAGRHHRVTRRHHRRREGKHERTDGRRSRRP